LNTLAEIGALNEINSEDLANSGMHAAD